MKSFFKELKKKITTEKPIIETISNITDSFTNEKYIVLSNKEKIEYIGMIESNPYFLFSYNQITFYLKFIQTNGFSIISNTDELNNNIVNTGKVDKLPNPKKISHVLTQIDKVDNLNIFNVGNILKIGHINSIYSRDSKNKNYFDESVVDYSEYLLVYNGFKTVLCYSFLYGYSVINNY